ncbi:MAG TPA: mechanosensitive ion channel family protein [Candidatus Baltobacteraceae bacterium]|nr:mechanosensitive ion channel family protein [Candidatus Baltobacteraceae bacterium]
MLRHGVLAAFLLALAPQAAAAQVLPVPFSTSAPASNGIETSGIFETAPISLDGATLFRVAEPLSAGAVPITDRQNTVETALQEIVAPVELNGRSTTAYDPATIKVGVRKDNGQTVLAATDARHTEPLTIVTVTADDAQYYGDSVADIAANWQSALQDALSRALEKRQPATMRQHVTLVEEAGIALIVFTALMLIVLAAMGRRLAKIHAEEERRRADAERNARGAGAPGTPHQQRRRLLVFALRALRGDEPGRALRSVRTTLIYALLLLWFGTVVWALSLFPDTTPYARSLGHDATAILGTWIIAAVLNRLLDFAIARASNAWARDGGADGSARSILRAPTIARALSGFKAFILVFLAALATMGEVGIPVGSVVTIGGLIAVAVSLAAQNFVRDFLNGFLVLFEDQYVIGDFVTINGMTGLVEALTLRMVQLRDSEGSLVTVPHSAVTNVINHSRNWSRVDYRLSLDPAADPFRAIELLRGALDEIAKDPAWRDAVLIPVEWIGIDGFTHDWTLVRASVKTAPLRQYELRREINARVRRAFAAENIGYGPAITADQIPPA